MGINPKTVAERRNRATVEDRKTGPKEPRSSVLTEQEEAMIVAFRQCRGSSHESATGSRTMARAAMESFFSSLKTERIGKKICRNRDAARADVFDRIERFYNTVRRHPAIGHLSPVEFEQRAGSA